MNFAFEAALISVSIGAVLSVLLQSGLLSNVDEQLIPPKVVLCLRAADVWLAVVFGLVVVILFAVSLQALADHAPLEEKDRDMCLHLLLLAAAYPTFTALAKRTLPILYAAPDVENASPRFQILVFVLPLIALVVAILLLPLLLDPERNLGTNLVLIAVAGVVVVGPCLLPAALSPWWRRRFMRRIRASARELRLVEQVVTTSVPHAEEQLRVRVFFESEAARCWIDRREAARVVGHVGEAVYRARREGIDATKTDRWWVHAWPNRRLSVRHGRARGTPRHEWPCDDDYFEATALLQSLAARMPLNER